MSKRSVTESHHFLKCDRCHEEVELETNPFRHGTLQLGVGDGWEVVSDLCPQCYKSVKEFVTTAPLGLHFEVQFNPKKMEQAMGRGIGKMPDEKHPEGCTCPPPPTETKVHFDSFSWEYKPCPLHLTRVTI